MTPHIDLLLNWFRWVLPWAQLDWILKIQFLIWLAAVGAALAIWWRSVVRNVPWLAPRNQKGQKKSPPQTVS